MFDVFVVAVFFLFDGLLAFLLSVCFFVGGVWGGGFPTFYVV